ncbi:hypothetical protein [Microbispora rosea]|uniref:hypothetical protein n=1 Tax=Microbispora rosea TaxID=58117 RepID=UPI003426924A
MERYQDELETLIDMVLSPLCEQIRAQAIGMRCWWMGLVVPTGERNGIMAYGAFCATRLRRHILLSGERFRRLFDEVKGSDGMA